MIATQNRFTPLSPEYNNTTATQPTPIPLKRQRTPDAQEKNKKQHTTETEYNTENRIQAQKQMQNKFQYTVALDNIPSHMLKHTCINITLSQQEIAKHILRAKVTQSGTTLLLLARNEQSFRLINNKFFWQSSNLFNGKAVPRLPQNTNLTALVHGITCEDDEQELEKILKQQLDGVSHISRVHNHQKQPINIIQIHFRNKKALATAIQKRYFQLHFTIHEINPHTSAYMCRKCWQYDHKTEQCSHKQVLPTPNSTCFTCKTNEHKTMCVKCPEYRRKTRELVLAMRDFVESFDKKQTAKLPERPAPARTQTYTSTESETEVETTPVRRVLLPTPRRTLLPTPPNGENKKKQNEPKKRMLAKSARKTKNRTEKQTLQKHNRNQWRAMTQAITLRRKTQATTQTITRTNRTQTQSIYPIYGTSSKQ